MEHRRGGHEGDWRGERRVYGFVEAAPSQENDHVYIDIVLDAVGADWFDAGKAQARAPEYLAIIRILTTISRLAELFNVGRLTEGGWYEVVLGFKPGNPKAWILDAVGDYNGPVIRTNVVDLAPIGDLSSLKGTPTGPLALELYSWCAVAANSTAAIRVTVASKPPLSHAPHIRMIDVGHASCAAVHVARDPNSAIIGYYDVGAPVFFHRKTFPKAFFEEKRVPNNGFVVLSHWDFDHYALAVTKLKSLQALKWYAPNQAVGPNAARLQTLLGINLRFIDAIQVPILSGFCLWRGQGLKSDRNNSGYVLRGERGRKSALLTGDVSYGAIAAATKKDLTGLGVTHHGGNGCANPPTPLGNGRAVVSYGRPNRYGHPSESHLSAHEAAGWTVRRTAGDSQHPRGDVWLL
jgi:beta-lactamase superfamily II metal-dependent hydrolase